jgi:pimeloyl-ACP methyl ester carboxylesterase
MRWRKSEGMRASGVCGFFACGGATLLAAASARADVAAHPSVVGADVTAVDVADARRRFEPTTWDELGKAPRTPGLYTLRVRASGVEAVELPVCAGRRKITLDGVAVPTPHGPAPIVVRLPDAAAHEVQVDIAVSGYEKRVACGAPPRAGSVKPAKEGLSLLTFTSPQAMAGGGRAVVFVPPGHDTSKAGALLVGTHPWDGSVWTYAAYAELLREAAAKDVVLLMPSGLGNSLYTAPAEDEVMRAIGELSAQVAIDPRRVSIWGASMGGAGATTIGLHRPDRFAHVTSLFGDSRYDLSTYVRSILRDDAAAHAVNALDVVDNARHVPVWLIHGEDDRISPITQSSMLARALTERRYAVRFDRVPSAGHEGGLVARFLPEIVARAAEAHVPEHPTRVTFKSVRAEDTDAYGVHVVRDGGGDAFVDLERRPDGVHVLRASGVKAITLAKGALGAPADAAIVLEPGVPAVVARWDAAR